MTKQEQRQKILARRSNLSQLEVTEKSEIIKNKLFNNQEFNQAQTILIYVNFDNEVQTETIIKNMLAQDKRVIVPITNDQEKKLELSELKEFTKELTPSQYGILEPKTEYRRLIEPEELDLIVAPGVGFDQHFNRLGYGGGYYDRLLSSIPDVPVVALAFIEQIVDKIKTDAHDQKVDKIITDQKIIR